MHGCQTRFYPIVIF